MENHVPLLFGDNKIIIHRMWTSKWNVCHKCSYNCAHQMFVVRCEKILSIINNKLNERRRKRGAKGQNKAWKLSLWNEKETMVCFLKCLNLKTVKDLLFLKKKRKRKKFYPFLVMIEVHEALHEEVLSCKVLACYESDIVPVSWLLLSFMIPVVLPVIRQLWLLLSLRMVVKVCNYM